MAVAAGLGVAVGAGVFVGAAGTGVAVGAGGTGVGVGSGLLHAIANARAAVATNAKIAPAAYRDVLWIFKGAFAIKFLQ